MPKYTIYIRNEDDAKWKAIDDKPSWLHEHLDTKPFTVQGNMLTGNPNVAPNPFKNRLCEHYQPKGQCMVKGCKYARGKK